MAKELWERQVNEGRKAFAAFVVYRDMGEHRSTAKVAQALGKSKQLMDRWSSAWEWVLRVQAWDALADQERRTAALAAHRAGWTDRAFRCTD